MIGTEKKAKFIFSLIKDLPYFNIDDVSPIEKNKTYLTILFYRYSKAGKFIRLKKGLYTTNEFINRIQKNGLYPHYIEFISNILYTPSYLSMEYILSQHNIITEFTTNFTSVSLNKTKYFSNKLGKFFYHKIKKELFSGFEIYREGEFTILKATKSKALFDFLYFRKKILPNEKSIEELRLNLNSLTRMDMDEIYKYVYFENSNKMKEIFKLILKLWKH